MNFKHSILCAAALSALAMAPLAQAQQNNRADVKAGATAAAASGATKGELSTPNQDKGMKPRASAETRADVKAQAAAANKASGPAGVGETSGTQGKKPMPMAGAESRAQVKAEAAAAVKDGKLPKGEASKKDQDRGGSKP